MASGTRTSRSSTPSLLRACPSRPPVVLASAVYRALFSVVTMAHSSKIGDVRSVRSTRRSVRLFRTGSMARPAASDASPPPAPEVTDQLGRGPVLVGQVGRLLVDEGGG